MEYEYGDLILYTEIETGFLYDVKFFDSYVLVRPATPEFYSNVIKVDLGVFGEHFEEYCGNYEFVRKFLFPGDDGVNIIG